MFCYSSACALWGRWTGCDTTKQDTISTQPIWDFHKLDSRIFCTCSTSSCLPRSLQSTDFPFLIELGAITLLSIIPFQLENHVTQPITHFSIGKKMWGGKRGNEYDTSWAWAGGQISKEKSTSPGQLTRSCRWHWHLFRELLVCHVWLTRTLQPKAKVASPLNGCRIARRKLRENRLMWWPDLLQHRVYPFPVGHPTCVPCTRPNELLLQRIWHNENRSKDNRLWDKITFKTDRQSMA